MARRRKLELIAYTPDAEQRALYEGALAGDGFEVTVCSSVTKLRGAPAPEDAVALVDVTSKPSEGAKAIRLLRRDYAGLVIVATGTAATDEEVAAARRAGADLFFPVLPEAPAALAELLRTVHAGRMAERQRDEAVSRVRALQTQLENAGFIDPLTGAFDERFLRMRLSEEISRATRYGRDLALVMVDVDHYTRFVENHGERLGNYLLRQAYAAIRWSTRPSDCIGRAEDDKFLVILPEADLHSALRASEKIRLGIEESHFATSGDKGGEDVTVSIGVASFQSGMTTPDDMLRCAEAALYQAKVRGKNMVCS
jgi:diguanylate cyclase (GGDEF)-like protein